MKKTMTILAAAFLAGTGLDVATITPQIEGKFISAFVRGLVLLC